MEAEQQESDLVKFLLELVLGQWNAVPDTHGVGADHPTTRLARLLAEQLRTLIYHKGYVHPHRDYAFVQFGVLLLDGELMIRAIGQSTASFFQVSENTLYRSDFTGYLTPDSQKVFHEALTSLQTGATPIFKKLQFEVPYGPLVEAECFLEPLLYQKDALLVSFFALQPVSPEPSGDAGERGPQRSTLACQQVYDYIQNHTSGALPTTREFARRFGTNEYELTVSAPFCPLVFTQANCGPLQPP